MKEAPGVSTFETTDALNRALVERLTREIQGEPRGPTALMLSGGTTPLQAYRTLGAQAPRPAAGLRILYSDERHVPVDSEASNYRNSRPLLDALALPEDHILRVRTELPLERAAQDYDERLRGLLDAGVPVRLGLLGLGADGHTASLFSGEDLSRAVGRLAIPVQRPDGRTAVSVTPEFLARAGTLLFVVSGADKRAALQAFLQSSPDSVAARAVAACPNVEVWTDRAARGVSAPG